MIHVEPELLRAEACDWTSPEEHDRVTAHLDDCPECLDRFAGYCAECTILEAATRSGGGRRSRVLLAAAIIPFALVFGAILWKGGRPEPTSGSAAAPPPPPPLESTPAAVQQPVQQEKDGAFSFLGTLHPSREVSIFSKVQAHVERVEVARGSRVKKGDLLITLKAPELEALADEARARLKQDEADVQRLEAMVAKAVVSAQELEVARGRVILDKPRLSVCEANVSYLKIFAPFDGIISDRAVEEGSLVGPAAGSATLALLQLQNIDRLRLTVSLFASSEPTLDHAVRGDRVSFMLRDRPEKKMSGSYLGSTRTVDPATGAFTVDVEVDNSSLGLLPGMWVQVAWPPAK